MMSGPMERIPIAQLHPELSSLESKQFLAVVTLVWPYSSTTRQCAFLLAEPDARLRRKGGQVRARFTGPAAQAVATTGIGIGDQITLDLRGVQFVQQDTEIHTPGKSIQWELSFCQRLILRTSHEGEERVIDINQHGVDIVSPSGSPGSLSSVSTPFVGHRLPSIKSWSSPAFSKRIRVSEGSAAHSAYDPLLANEEDDPARKKRRKSYKDWHVWRYTSRTPSPEVADQGMVIEATLQPEETPSRPTRGPAPPSEAIQPAGILSLNRSSTTEVSPTQATITDTLAPQPSSPATAKITERLPSVHDDATLETAEDMDVQAMVPETMQSGIWESIDLEGRGAAEAEAEQPVEPEVEELIESEMEEQVEPGVKDSVVSEIEEAVAHSKGRELEPEIQESLEPEHEEVSQFEVQQRHVEPQIQDFSHVTGGAFSGDSPRFDAVGDTELNTPVTESSLSEKASFAQTVRTPPAAPSGLPIAVEEGLHPGSAPKALPRSAASSSSSSNSSVIMLSGQAVTSTSVDHNAQADTDGGVAMEQLHIDQIEQEQAPRPVLDSIMLGYEYDELYAGPNEYPPEEYTATEAQAEETFMAPNQQPLRVDLPVTEIEEEPESPVIKPLDSSTLPLPSPFPGEHDQFSFLGAVPAGDTAGSLQRAEDPDAGPEYIMGSSFFNPVGMPPDAAFGDVRFSFGLDGSVFSTFSKPASSPVQSQDEKEEVVVVVEQQVEVEQAVEVEQMTVEREVEVERTVEVERIAVEQPMEVDQEVEEQHGVTEEREAEEQHAMEVETEVAAEPAIQMGQEVQDEQEVEEDYESRDEHGYDEESLMEAEREATVEPAVEVEREAKVDEEVFEELESQHAQQEVDEDHAMDVEQEGAAETAIEIEIEQEVEEQTEYEYEEEVESSALEVHREVTVQELDDEAMEVGQELEEAEETEEEEAVEMQHEVQVEHEAEENETVEEEQRSEAGQAAHGTQVSGTQVSHAITEIIDLGLPTSSESGWFEDPDPSQYEPAELASFKAAEEEHRTTRSRYEHVSYVKDSEEGTINSEQSISTVQHSDTAAYPPSSPPVQMEHFYTATQQSLTLTPHPSRLQQSSTPSPEQSPEQTPEPSPKMSNIWLEQAPGGPLPGVNWDAIDDVTKLSKEEIADILTFAPTEDAEKLSELLEGPPAPKPSVTSSLLRRSSAPIIAQLDDEHYLEHPAVIELFRKHDIDDLDTLSVERLGDLLTFLDDFEGELLAEVVNKHRAARIGDTPAPSAPSRVSQDKSSKASEAPAGLSQPSPHVFNGSYLEDPAVLRVFEKYGITNIATCPQETIEEILTFGDEEEGDLFADVLNKYRASLHQTEDSPRSTVESASNGSLDSNESTVVARQTRDDLPAIGLSTPLAYYTPLSRLSDYFGRPSQHVASTQPDVLCLVLQESSKPKRADKGPRHWSTTFRITDRSIYPESTTVQVFRPHRDALPICHVGDPILLRSFAVRTSEGRFMLVSGDESAWCVYNWGKPGWGAISAAGEDVDPRWKEVLAKEEMRGPVVERGEGEWKEVGRIRKWWMEDVRGAELQRNEERWREDGDRTMVE